MEVGVIALPGFVLGCPCFKHQTGGLGTCAPPPPQVSGSFKFKPRPSGGKKKKGRSGDRRAIGAPLGAKEFYLWLLLNPALECLVV